jgi:hypothetical protein
MAMPYIKAHPLPFITSFVGLLSPCNNFFQGRLCGLQINLLKANTNIHIITSILTRFAESIAKVISFLRSSKSKKNTYDHEIESSCDGGKITTFILHIGN